MQQALFSTRKTLGCETTAPSPGRARGSKACLQQRGKNHIVRHCHRNKNHRQAARALASTEGSNCKVKSGGQKWPTKSSRTFRTALWCSGRQERICRTEAASSHTWPTVQACSNSVAWQFESCSLSGCEKETREGHGIEVQLHRSRHSFEPGPLVVRRSEEVAGVVHLPGITDLLRHIVFPGHLLAAATQKPQMLQDRLNVSFRQATIYSTNWRSFGSCRAVAKFLPCGRPACIRKKSLWRLVPSCKA